MQKSKMIFKEHESKMKAAGWDGGKADLRCRSVLQMAARARSEGAREQREGASGSCAVAASGKKEGTRMRLSVQERKQRRKELTQAREERSGSVHVLRSFYLHVD